MANIIPPTDTRRRPDQRALELGDFKLAAKEKERLEVKQRQVRKYNEKSNIEHKVSYFQKKFIDEDNQFYYVYNHKYFEHDRNY